MVLLLRVRMLADTGQHVTKTRSEALASEISTIVQNFCQEVN